MEIKKRSIQLVSLLALSCAVIFSAQARKSSDIDFMRHFCNVAGAAVTGGFWQCDWLKENDEGDEKNRFQDLKNFLALSQLRQAKADADLMFLKPPYLSETMLAGYKDKQARALQKDYKDKSEIYYGRWNMLTTENDFNEEKFLRQHLDNSCTTFEAGKSLCKSNGGGKPEDLSAGSLFSEEVLDTAAKREVAGQYIQNLTNPVPVPLLSDDKLFMNKKKGILSDDGKQNLSAKFRQQIIVSLSQDSYVDMMAERLPVENADNHDKNQPFTSRLSILETEANRRFNSPAWYNEMNALSTEGLLREIANMMALRLTMDFRNSQKIEKMEALLAAQLAYAGQIIGTNEVARQLSTDALPDEDEDE